MQTASTNTQRNTCDLLQQASDILRTAPPDTLISELLALFSRYAPQAILARFFENQEGLLTANANAPAIAPSFEDVLGFPFSAVQINLDHAAQLQTLLAADAARVFPAADFAALINGLLTAEQLTQLQAAYGYESGYLCPLRSNGESLGLLLVLLRETMPDPATLTVLEQLAGFIALALEKKHHRTCLAQQEKQIASLHSVNARVVRSLDLHQVMHQAVQEVTQTLAVEASAISLIEPESGDLVIQAQQGLHQFAHTPVRLPKGKGVAWETLRQGRMTIIESWEDEPRLATPEFLAEDVHTTAMVPMFVGDEPVGVLSAMSRVPRRFTRAELQLLISMADQVAIALANARLHEQTHRQATERAFLFRLAESIAPLQEVDAIAQIALEQTLRFLDWPSGLVLLEDPHSGALSPRSRIGDAETLRALLPQIRQTSPVQRAPAVAVHRSDAPPQVIIQTPIHARQQLLGWLVTTHPTPTLTVSDQLCEVLANVGKHLGIAIENVLLYQEMAERERSTRALYQIAHAMHGLDLEQTLEQSLSSLHQAITYDIAYIVLLTPTPAEIVKLQITASPEHLDALQQHAQASLETLTGLPYTAQVERRILRAESQTGTLEDGQLLSYLEVPVMQKDRPIGVLLLARRQPFRTREQRLLFILGYQISNTLVTLHLYQQAQQQARELSQTHQQLAHHESIQEHIFTDIVEDIRNPTTLIQGYIDLLIEAGLEVLTPQQQQASAIIQQQSRLLAGLVHNLGALKLLHSCGLNCRQVEVKRFIQQTVEFACENTPHNVRPPLQCEFAPQLPPLYCDPERLQQALVNLIQDLGAATPPETSIQLRVARPHAQQFQITLSNTASPARSVSPLEIAPQPYPGSSINLSLARRVITAHGGKLIMHGDERHGYTFSITLPVNQTVKGEAP